MEELYWLYVEGISEPFEICYGPPLDNVNLMQKIASESFIRGYVNFRTPNKKEVIVKTSKITAIKKL